MSKDVPLDEQQFRKFSCVTYLSESQLQECLQRSGDMIRGFAYCYHDKDIAEDGTLKAFHAHLVLWLYNPRKLKSIRGWFDCGYKDEKGEKINTLIQPCHDVKASAEYLMHKNDPDKYQYPPESVVYSDPLLFEFPDTQKDDVALLSLEDLLNGLSLRACASKYGRDFMFHYGHIRQLYVDIIRQEQGRDFI